MKTSTPYTIKTTFIVSGSDVDAKSILQLCRILSLATEHTDAAIQRITGALDFNRIRINHFNLDVEGQAQLYDVVVFHSHTYVLEEDQVMVTLSASTKRGRRTMPLINGSFVFTIRKGVPIGYSLS